MYQNLVTTPPFSIFLPSFFLPCKDTYLWMIMMESKIVMVLNMILQKYLITFDSLFVMKIKI
jgi:hypothetical protein